MKDYFVHETAIVDEGATIGKGTKIWHFSHIMSNCRPHPYIRDRRAGRTLLSGASRGRERESKGVERSSDSPEAGTLRLATLHESESCKRGGHAGLYIPGYKRISYA